MKLTIKRFDKPACYLPYEMRCRFAVETVRSLQAPVNEQVIELELMFADDDEC